MMNDAGKQNGDAALAHMGDEDGATDHLKRMFRSWRDIDAKMTENDAAAESGANPAPDNEAFRLAQSALMNTAAAMRGTTSTDILYKLAFWRWDADALGASLDEMGRGEALVYSAFRDLAELTGETDVVTELDRRTDFLRKPDLAASE